HLRNPLRLSGSRKPPLSVRAITVGKRSLFPASRAEAVALRLVQFILRLIQVAFARLDQSKPQMWVGRMRKQIPRFFEIGAGVLQIPLQARNVPVNQLILAPDGFIFGRKRHGGTESRLRAAPGLQVNWSALARLPLVGNC